VERHFDSTIRIASLAAEIKLTPSRFSGAFRASFGVSATRYIVRRRLRLAQQLMLNTTLPLAHIAVACGMYDQPQFTRLFQRYVGHSPGAWRRARQACVRRPSRRRLPGIFLIPVNDTPLSAVIESGSQ
jgi:AraC-like DNA-binding protein